MRLILQTIFLCHFLPFTLQLTIAVLAGNKLDSGNLDQITSSSSGRHVHLETRCQMQSYPNGKIFNCSSSKPPSTQTGKSLQYSKGQQVQVQPLDCELNSHRVGESCVCISGYKKFPLSDVCVKEEGHRCTFKDKECRPDMTYMGCINNVCSCESSDLYDELTMTCQGKVGGLCYPGVKECIGNAVCVNVPQQQRVQRDFMRRSAEYSSFPPFYFQQDEEPSDPHNHQLFRASSASTDYVISPTNDIELSGRCECKEGYMESEDGLCKKGFGETCTSSDQCDSHNLVCKEGICSCPSSVHIYDFISKSCVALVGAQCLENPMISVPGATLCVKHAYCKKSNLRSIGMGRCTCVEGAIETRMRTCVMQEQQQQQERAREPINSASSPQSQTSHQQSNIMRIPEYKRNIEVSSSRVLFSDYD